MARENLLGKALCTVRHAIRISEAGLATQASSQQIYTPTSTGGIHEISSTPPHPRAKAHACPSPPSEFSTCFSDPSADSSPEVLDVAPGIVPGIDPSLTRPEHGPCIVGGINTLVDASFITKIAVHSGANALAPYGCVALLDTGFPHTFIKRDVFD